MLELWKRLRDERVFDSEADLIEQIAKDVAETRAVERPGLGNQPGQPAAEASESRAWEVEPVTDEGARRDLERLQADRPRRRLDARLV